MGAALFGETLPLEAKRQMRWSLFAIRLREEAERLGIKQARISIASIIPPEGVGAFIFQGKSRWKPYREEAVQVATKVFQEGIEAVPNASHLVVDGKAIGLIIAVSPKGSAEIDALRELVAFRPNGYEDWFRTT